MRIGFVTGEYPPMEGGVADFTRDMSRALVPQGHSIWVFTRRQAVHASEPGIDVSPAVVGKWGWSTNASIKMWAAQNHLDLVNIQFQTAAYNMHAAIHWLPRVIRNIPIVVTFHDLRVPYLFPKAGPLRTWIVRQLARTADGVIATDRADENTLREWKVQNVRQIPIGCNRVAALAAGYDRQARRATLGIQPDDLVISYFGFLNQSKGVLILLEALRLLIDQEVPAHLIMIGGRVGASDPTNSDYAAQVDADIRQHGLDSHIHWTGFVEDAELSACFHDSDFVVLPYLDGVSLRRSALMAALAHGRPVVTTTPRTELPELAGAIETVPPGDSETLAAKLLSLWHNPSRRRALEQAVPQTAQYFGRDRIARETVDFFSELCNRHVSHSQ